MATPSREPVYFELKSFVAILKLALLVFLEAGIEVVFELSKEPSI